MAVSAFAWPQPAIGARACQLLSLISYRRCAAEVTPNSLSSRLFMIIQSLSWGSQRSFAYLSGIREQHSSGSQCGEQERSTIMQTRSIQQDLHLTYCTNIHPGNGWNEVYANLQQYAPLLKRQLSPKAPF